MASKSKQIALGGVSGTLCLISLYFAVYLPTSKLFFYGLSSVFSAIIIVESNVKLAWVFYGAMSLLSFFVIPNKIGVVPYAAFFGLYGIIKYHIEGMRNIFFEMIVKGGYFLISMLLSGAVAKELFVSEVRFRTPIWAIGIIGLIFFYIYDYIYTMFIVYYENKLRKMI